MIDRSALVPAVMSVVSFCSSTSHGTTSNLTVMPGLAASNSFFDRFEIRAGLGAVFGDGDAHFTRIRLRREGQHAHSGHQADSPFGKAHLISPIVGPRIALLCR